MKRADMFKAGDAVHHMGERLIVRSVDPSGRVVLQLGPDRVVHVEQIELVDRPEWLRRVEKCSTTC